MLGAIAGLLAAAPMAPALAATQVEPAAAAAAAGPVDQPIEAGVETLRLPLAKLLNAPGSLRLERVKSEASLQIPVNLRMTLRSAKLKLHLTNSIALLKHRSQLVVALNDRVVSQVPLDGGHPTRVLDVRLPVDDLKADFNRLTLSVAQHYAIDTCEDPFAPELWTEIDAVRSYVELDVAYRPLRPRLADLAEIFSAKDPSPRRIALMSGSEELLDEAMLRAGSLVAQGIALRLRNVPLEVIATKPRKVAYPLPAPLGGLDPEAFGPRDGVLFGTIDQLAPLVGSAIAEDVRGPYLAVYPLPADPRRLVVVVSGRDEAELKTAATAFAFLDAPFPETPSAVVRDVALPTWPDYAGHNVLALGQTYSFQDLNVATQTLDGLNKAEAALTVALPADAWVLGSDKLPLSLHFSHGANLRANSVVTILVNGQFADAIPISDTRAHVYEGQRVALPLRLFRPGQNTITIAPHFLPEGEGACKPIPTDGLPMTIFRDSTLTVPKLPHFAEMPDLALFGRTGFPYTRTPDGNGTRLWVGGYDLNTLAAAWTLMGRLAQTSGMPLFRMQCSFDPSAPPDDLLVVGPRAALPSDLLARLDARRADDQPAAARTAVTFAVGNAAPETLMAAQLESPYARGKTATIFTAESARSLRNGVHSFVHPAAWDGLQGSRTDWDPRGQQVASQRSDYAYTLGHLSPFFAIGRFATRHPIAFAGLALALAGLLVLGLTLWLRRRTDRERKAPDDAPTSSL